MAPATANTTEPTMEQLQQELADARALNDRLLERQKDLGELVKPKDPKKFNRSLAKL